MYNYYNIENFDWKIYLENNQDLNNINTEKKAIIHFINYGIKEYRIINEEMVKLWNNYDWVQYKNKYSTLKILNEWDAFFHYYLLGKEKNHEIFKKKEILFFEKDNNYKKYFDLYKKYDWEIYLSQYPDLKKANIKSNFECFVHYINHGINEKRKIIKKKEFINNNFDKNSFDYDFFLKMNSHLKNINKIEDALYYLEYNEDLDKIIYNIKQKELYVKYDWNKYINYYDDLKKNINNEIDGFKHYLTFGTNENREIFDKNEFKNIIDKNVVDKNIVDKNVVDKNVVDKNIVDKNYIPKFFKFISNNNNNNEIIKFSFVISSYNNENNICNNLISIILQSYKNWEIYYINDNSTDKTEELFFKIIKIYEIENKVFYTKNKTNMKQSYNKYQSYQKIDKKNVVVILDGDDWLSKNNVLEELNKIYINEKCHMAYSGYFIYENDNIDRFARINKYNNTIKINGDYRKQPNWYFTHLRTGYAWLFKMIPKEYLMIDGKWIDRCTDWGELYPCAELAKEKIYEINDYYYIYNKNNSLNYSISYYNDKDSIERKKIETYIKSCFKVTMELPKIFIINLEKDNENKKCLLKQLKEQNVNNFEFFNAHYAVEDEISKKIYQEYVEKYNNYKIPRKVFGVEKLHINSIGALGVIQTTLKLYQYINNTTNLDHVIIFEDDIYLNKDIINQFHITNIDLKNCDFMYIGHNCANKELLTIRKKDKKNIFNLKEELNHINIYGAYSFICSRKFRNFVIEKGLNYFIDSNLNLDCFYASLYKTKENDLQIKLYNDHLCIPEVRKDGINNKRSDFFYIEREIDLKEYMII